MNKEIRETLKQLADPSYQEFHSNLCPGVTNILGVRVPVLRNYAKELIKQEDVRKILGQLETTVYEEVMLEGMILGFAKMDLEERLTYLAEFIPKIDNWAVCDVTCAGLKFTKKNLDRMWQFLQPYLSSRKEFEVRFGVVMLLDYYLVDSYIDLVIKQLDTIKQEDYYVKMAMAWTISVAYIKYPEKTQAYLAENTLDAFTYQKALQKILESNRVSRNEKEKIRKMKKNTRK